jgi:predicted ATPase
MLREIAEAIEAISAETPLIIVLEDLHWSDYSTVDLVAYLARRTDRARLMAAHGSLAHDAVDPRRRHGCEQLVILAIAQRVIERRPARAARGFGVGWRSDCYTSFTSGPRATRCSW